ncbi:hypothetical protein NDU88_001818 [Pleurodeles waltl]|uniref:Uncharacterized protein n=1 Tax=Pleurodeles waltl TaxID=8319 RepID=A0AAV7WJI0_PLEWA|nr:hypothetical protein NDU88_001818 [Pleurodeles waltl]
MESCPRGTAGRTDEQEVTSDLYIRVTRTEILRGEKRKWCVPDKPEEDLWTETEERVTPRTERGTGTWEADECETTNDVRGNPETKKQLRPDPKTPTETPRRNGESHHVPGGAWHTQVRLYLKLKLLPEWMRGGRNLEGAEGGLGQENKERGNGLTVPRRGGEDDHPPMQNRE